MVTNPHSACLATMSCVRLQDSFNVLLSLDIACSLLLLLLLLQYNPTRAFSLPDLPQEVSNDSRSSKVGSACACGAMSLVAGLSARAQMVGRGDGNSTAWGCIISPEACTCSICCSMSTEASRDTGVASGCCVVASSTGAGASSSSYTCTCQVTGLCGAAWKEPASTC